jgi:hypothetical protein
MAQTVIAGDPLVTLEDEYSVGLDALGRVRISPTDVSQFIRLEQCERYLRLRLHERSAGLRFMVDYGVVPQSIPPLLTQSGTRFEEDVERTVATRFRTVNLADAIDVPLWSMAQRRAGTGSGRWLKTRSGVSLRRVPSIKSTTLPC